MMAKKIKGVIPKSKDDVGSFFNFDKSTISLLENFVSINPSIEFLESDLIDTVSITKTMYASGKLNCKIPRSFCVDLAKFLNFISLFDDYKINLYDYFLTISHEKEQFKMNYLKSDLIVKPNRDEEIILPSVDAEFSITKEQLQKMFKACSIVGVSDLFFKGMDNNVSVVGQNTRDTSSDTYSVDYPAIVKKHIECNIKVEDLKILLDNYVVKICVDGIAHFQGSLGQQYYIGVEVL